MQLSRSQLTLFCAARRCEDGERGAPRLSRRSCLPARRFSGRSTLIETSRAQRTEAIDVPRRAFSPVKLGSYPAWSLRGSKSRQPTLADSVRRLVVCKASPSPSPSLSTDPKRNVDGERTPRSVLARELSDENSSPSPFRPQLRLRVCSSAHGNHHPSAAWLGLL